MKQILLSVVSILLGMLSVYYAAASNFNLGNLVVWILTAVVIGYTLFWRKLDPILTGTLPGKIFLGLVLVGCLVLGGTLAVIVSGQVKHTADGTEDTLVVLGCAVHGDQPSLVLTYRLRAALDFYEQNPGVTIVVCGGQGPQENISEALAMKRWLVAHGVPEQQVVMEARSTSTEENFRFAAEILRQQGKDPAQPIAYVTNGFHCYRAGKYAAREGFVQAHAVPAGLPPTQILASYLRESLAVLYYWVFKSASTGPLHKLVGFLYLG